jgi:undecaprenyl diphosphate synthase
MSAAQISVSPASTLHVAVTMDGNGRWAERRGLPRPAGHRQGALAVRKIVEAAPGLGIRTLTLYAFSADNWRRPRAEILALMAIFGEYLREVEAEGARHGVRFTLIGRRDRLPPSIARQAALLETATAGCRALQLRIAIDYSAREAIWLAADRLIRSGQRSREEFIASIRSGRGTPADAADVDLLVRTGGEQRLSDFLLWESAYAELWFTDVLWPDFTPRHLESALESFARRERRFGGVGARLPALTAGT